MKIDVHGHIYPDEYLNQMEKMSDIMIGMPCAAPQS